MNSFSKVRWKGVTSGAGSSDRRPTRSLAGAVQVLCLPEQPPACTAPLSLQPSTLSDALSGVSSCRAAGEETWGSPRCVPHYQEDLTASSWHVRTVSCQAGPVSEHSECSSVLQHLPKPFLQRFHSFQSLLVSWQQLLPLFPRGRGTATHGHCHYCHCRCCHHPT